MRILIGSAHPYLPQLLGGAQSSTHELALALQKEGHKVCVVGGLSNKGWFGLRRRLELKLRRRSWVSDDYLGYPVYRAWFAKTIVAEVARNFKADIVMFQSGLPFEMAKAMTSTEIPIVIYLHNVENDDIGGDLTKLDGISYIANSRFTAERFAQVDGVVAEVVYPMVDAERYRTQSTRKNVTFINPHPYKGVGIALQVAEACPEIPFVFVKAWTLSSEDEETLRQHAERLDNLIVRGPTTNMKLIYGDTKILLAPSCWEEAFGRVAAEAHLSGIPVVGSDRGGLPEAIGPGGIVLAPSASVKDWASAVRTLWSDEPLYQAISDAARRYSERDEMKSDKQIERLIDILADAVEKGRR